MSRFALVLGILSLGCSLSVSGFFIGVPLGLLGAAVALMYRGDVGTRTRRTSTRAFVAAGAGLLVGLCVWLFHMRALEAMSRVPARAELGKSFDDAVNAGTASTGPPRPVAPTPTGK